MSDITREIEITAALSSEYQAAFSAASSIARDTAKELNALTKREAGLAKLTEIAGKAAAASIENDAKAVEKLQSEYAKLADKLGLVDRSAEGVAAEMRRVGESKKELEALNRSAGKSAELGRLAQDIERYTKAAQKLKDPALLAALEKLKKRFKELGGALTDDGKDKEEDKPAGFFKTLKDGLLQVRGPIGGLVQTLSVVRDALHTTGGKAALVVGGITAVGAAAVKLTRDMWNLGVETIKAGDAIAKTSRQLGIDAEAYQEFSYAVALGGASESDFSASLQALNKQMEAAASGNSRAKQAFSALGVSMDEVKSMNVEEMFVRLSDALAEVDDTAAKTRTVMTLFGEGGTKVATAISGGSKALAEMREEARKTGYVMNGKSLKQAEKANDDYMRTQVQLRGVLRQLGVEIMPVINESLLRIINTIRDNRDTITSVIGALSTGFSIVGSVVGGAVDAVSFLFREAKAELKSLQDGFAKFVGWIVDTAAPGIAGFFAAIPQKVKEIASIVWDTATGLFNRAKSWVSSVVDSIVGAIMEKVRWLLERLESVPLIGQLFAEEKSGSEFLGKAFGAVSITINNAVDARGAAPGAGADVQRAIRIGTAESGEAVVGAIEKYSALQYASAGYSGASR